MVDIFAAKLVLYHQFESVASDLEQSGVDPRLWLDLADCDSRTNRFRREENQRAVPAQKKHFIAGLQKKASNMLLPF